jgi:fatty-acyl-CoA synthase
MNNIGIGSWMARRARMTPWKTAVVFGDETLTYAELDDRIVRLARGLQSLGIRRGDRIGYLGANHPAFLETLFAAGTLAAVFVPLHIRFAPRDLAHVLNHSECKAVVFGPEAEPIIDRIRKDVNTGTYISAGEGHGNIPSLASAIGRAPSTRIDETVGLDDLAVLAYTSGTTGLPKGVMLSHGNLTWNVVNLMSCADFLSDDVVLAQAPLFRMGGLGVTVLPGLFKGATIVITPTVVPDEIPGLIERHRVSVLFGSPRYFQALDEALARRRADLSSLRFCICGGDTVPETLIRGWLDRGIQFRQGYGLTEAAPVALLLDPEELRTNNGSAGRTMFFSDVQVLRSDLTPAEPGETGELATRGPNVTAGYWNDPEATRARISPDGWLRSGDAARMDGDGHVYVLGRMGDGIRLSGKIVLPSEIEKALAEHPDVRECAVVGIPLGDQDAAVAFVALRPGASPSSEALLAFAKDILPAELVPKRFEFLDALPKNPNGKILRRELRQSLEDRGRSPEA